MADFNIATIVWEQLWVSLLFMLAYLAAFDPGQMETLEDKGKNEVGNKQSVKEREDRRHVTSCLVVGVAYSGLVLASGLNSTALANPAREFLPRAIGG